MGSITAIGPLSIDMYLPALPGIAEHLSAGASFVQLSLTTFLLGLSLGQLFVGPLSDALGRRRPLLAGIVVYAVSSLLCALIPSIWALIVLRFIQGLAGSAGMVVARAVVRDLYSGTEMTRFISHLMLVNGVAPIVAPVIGAQLMLFLPWQGIFVTLALFGVALCLAIWVGLQETLPPARRSAAGIGRTWSTFKVLFRDKAFMGYGLVQGLISGALFAYISGSSFVIQNVFGASPQTYSLIFAMNSVGIVLATQVTGRLAGRIEERILFIAGISLAFCGAMFLLTAVLTGMGLYAVLIALFMVVSSVGIVNTTGFSLAMENQGAAAGSAAAVQGVLGFLFGGIAAPLVGLGGESTAVPLGIVIAGLCLGAVLCYLTLIRPEAVKARLGYERKQ
ncbi:MAG TPA: multidrug effflux MFS transporter [Clostridia bacterium]|nr:multidrug effflux MFS transporter [Clostridia bacterium]